MLEIDLFKTQKRWLITGVAGFIGSHLLEYLLKANQFVVGIDNFMSGSRSNLEEVLDQCSSLQRQNFSFMEGDLRHPDFCLKVVEKSDIILHQAAIASVPLSIEHPDLCHDHNVNGMMNLLLAAKVHRPKAIVYASSSSVYGDSEPLPKKECHSGNLLSPYAASKKIMEIYADTFSRCYNLNIVGLRYFNVFGPRQSKDGPYAAVIPIWIRALLNNDPVYLNGDGSTSRDFTYVQNVVEANILAAEKAYKGLSHDVFNIADGQQTPLKDLFALLVKKTKTENPQLVIQDFREGDILHSLASIDRATEILGYNPSHSLSSGIEKTINWYKS